MFHRIGLIASKRLGNGVRDTLIQTTELLRKRSVEIVFCKDCAEILGEPDVEVQEIPDFGKNLDLVIAIGGDGTILNAARIIQNNPVPLLGINRGTLGFLADVPADRVEEELSKILDGEFVEDKRFMLHGEVYRGNDLLVSSNAFNDIVVQKWNIARLVQFDTFIDGEFLLTQRSDGMIVSSPTGSTAYALSGGGPILNPSIDAMLLVPICPHTLSVRPVVIHCDSKIEIILGKRKIDQAGLTFDGDILAELEPEDRIIIQKSKQAVKLIHPINHNHFSILRAKLGWGL